MAYCGGQYWFTVAFWSRHCINHILEDSDMLSHFSRNTDDLCPLSIRNAEHLYRQGAYHNLTSKTLKFDEFYPLSRELRNQASHNLESPLRFASTTLRPRTLYLQLLYYYDFTIAFLKLEPRGGTMFLSHACHVLLESSSSIRRTTVIVDSLCIRN